MNAPIVAPCPPDITERVLDALGFASAPDPDAAGLSAVYRRWCERVPFDDVQKRIWVVEGADGPLPGATPEAFFRDWLEYGTGGTCWAGAGALGSLLGALGFSARRGVGTMLPGPGDGRPNHAFITVDLDRDTFIVDNSVLTGVPLALDGPVPAGVVGGAQLQRDEAGTTLLFWRPGHRPNGMQCRLDRLEADAGEYRERHEATRAWSFFNYLLNVRVVRGERAVSVVMGQRIEIGADGAVDRRPLDPRERSRVLVEEFGMSEAIVARIPEDGAIPPPPGMPPAVWAETLASLRAG